MNACVYDKTEKGREEIATRKYQVPPRLRSLLVMIDGRRSLDSLLNNFRAIGVTEDSINELLREELIAPVADAPVVAAPPPPPPLVPQPAAQLPLAEGERIAALHAFFNQTIKSTIGLRGVMLQLKVEKCNSVAEFRALRLPYLEAVQKAKGNEMAISLGARLNDLLGE